VVFWGINAADEQAVVMSIINPCKLEPLELSEIEIDEFTFHYSTIEPPHIQNDIITINQSYAADHQVSTTRPEDGGAALAAAHQQTIHLAVQRRSS